MKHLFLTLFAAAALTSCETTGDPNQGGLFGWSQIQATAFRTESRAVICTKALRGLIAELGESAKSFDRDLSTLQDDAAEAEFVRILQSLSVTPGQRYGLRELAERAIQTWCKQHDP